MNCENISCGYNSFIENGSCECDYYSLGNPSEICISPIEVLWYTANLFIFSCGIFSCFRKKRNNKYYYIPENYEEREFFTGSK